MTLAFEMVFIMALILVNGVLAMAEIAIVSSRKARLQQRAQDGEAGASVALTLAEKPSDFLATVQIGISLVGILAGAFGGATMAEQLAAQISKVQFLAPYRDALGVTAVVLVITYLSLIVGELVPKRLGLNDAESIAIRVARPMLFLARLAAPIVKFLSWSSEGILKLIGKQKVGLSLVTEEEIKILIEQGTQAGVFEEAEQDMVSAIFRLTDRRVGSLATPRTEVTWLDLEDPIESNEQKILESAYDHFPVARGSFDNVVGIIHSRDLLAASLNQRPLDLERLMVEPVMVPESMSVFQVLERFRQEHTQLALVFDEYGGIQGLVTINDILEAIVGDFPAFGKETSPGLSRREDGSWLIDGMLPIDEFKEHFRFKDLPREERADYETLGGFMMAHLGRIPKASDHFEWNGYRFEVMDMDGFRVDKVLVAPLVPGIKN